MSSAATLGKDEVLGEAVAEAPVADGAWERFHYDQRSTPSSSLAVRIARASYR